MKQELNAWAIGKNSTPLTVSFLNKKKPFLLFLAFASVMMLFANVSNAQGCTTCALGYPDNSNLPKSAVVFNESEVLRAMDPSSTSCGYASGYIKLWYNDEHALFLGVKSVIIKRASGTTTTNYPVTAYGGTPTCGTGLSFGTTIATGGQSGNDVADGGGRPIRPVLYLTDLTVNGPTSRIGDWQQGGTAYNPNIVCGSWKSGVKNIDSTVSPVNVTINPDTDPAKNDWNLGAGEAPPSGTTNQGYGALVKWDVNALGLLAGHIYRIQVMVHDGDQNKVGGDAGSMCTTIVMPPDCSCTNSASNLLTNGSFENGSTGWSVSGGNITTGTGFVVCGAANGFLNETSGTAKMWQDVTVLDGSVVTFKGYAGTHTPGISCSPRLSVIYLNGAGAVISQLDAVVTKDVDVTGSALELYTLTGTAPLGTVKVRIQGSIGCNTLKVDAFCLTVIPPPAVTNPDFNSTFVNVHVTGDVHTNDKVPTGTTYGTSPTLLLSPAGSAATIVMNSNGTYDFVGNTVGVYVYNVPVCVPGQVAPCPPTKLTITVLGPLVYTNAPVANVDIATTKINTPVLIKTLVNDAAGNITTSLVPSSVTVTVAPLHGTTSINPATGDNTYTPAAGYTGYDTLTYSVCDNQSPAKCATAQQIITIRATTASNTTAAADDYKITQINTPATGNVKTNDTDPEGNAQTVATQTTTVAGKGTLVLAADGSYTFTPVNGFTGPIDYPYTTCDNGVPQACASATLHILVRPEVPVTNPDINTTFVNVHVTGDVHTNDKVPVGTTYGTSPTLLSSPAGSVATIVMNSNGTYDFVANMVGVYTYDVPVCVPGQIAPCPPTKLVITVLDANRNDNAPVAHVDIATTNLNTPVTLLTLVNDAAGSPAVALVQATVTVTVAPLHGTTTVNAATGDITYTPAAGFSGNDTLTYVVSDNQTPAKSATAKQIITIKPAGAPNTTAAADDYKITPINTPATGNVKTNDTDPEGDAQTVATQNTTVAGKGNLILAADGSYTFTPFAGFSGPIDYPYSTCDNGVPQACASATLHILVLPAALLPDLTPSIFNDANTVFLNGSRDNAIRIFNIGAGPTSAPIIFTIPKMQPLFDIAVDPIRTAADVFGGLVVTNSDWTIVEEASRFVFTSKPGVVIPAGGSNTIGLTLTGRGIVNTTGNLSITIVFGTGGGETPFNNNRDNRTYSIN